MAFVGDLPQECMVFVANPDDFVPQGEPASLSQRRVTSVLLAFNAESLFHSNRFAVRSVVHSFKTVQEKNKINNVSGMEWSIRTCEWSKNV